MFFLRDAKYSIIFIIVACSIGYAQERVVQAPDSLKTFKQSEYKIRLSNNVNAFSPLFTMKQPFEDFNEMEFYSFKFEPAPIQEIVSMLQLRNEINHTMNIYRQGQNKYHLGVVSDILGYAGSAAALGLAAYHVSKYKKYYKLK